MWSWLSGCPWGGRHLGALLPLQGGPPDALSPTGRCEVPPSTQNVCVGVPARNSLHCSIQGPRNASSCLLHSISQLERISIYWDSHSCTYYDCGH